MRKIANFPTFYSIDESHLRRYINCTSLLSASAAGRGAASSEAALAFYRGIARGKGVVS